MSSGADTTPLGEPAKFPAGWREVAPDTHAWLQPNGDWGESNAGLVVGKGEAMLVDTLYDARLTQRMLGAAGDVLGSTPITTLVNTHGDYDHVGGNSLFAGKPIIATEHAAEHARSENPMLAARLSSAMRVFAPFRRLPGRLGRPAAGAAYVRRMLAPYDLAGVKPTPPDDTFTGERVVQVGGRTARLMDVSPAHTMGDLIVHLPDVNVVIAGDILFIGVTPTSWCGPSSAWVAALERILELDPVAIVPGHGPVGGRADVERMRDYWLWLADAAASPAIAPLSHMDAARTLLGSKEFMAAPWGTWLSPERILLNLVVLEHERNGTAPWAASPPTRVRLLMQIGQLAAEHGSWRHG